MFQLTEEEAKNLRFQIGISSGHHGGRRYLPYVFTEHGVAMLSSVVHSPRAVQVNILIVRAFIRLRQLLATHQDLARRIEEIERLQKKQGRRLRGICSVVMQLIDVPSKPKASFGFKS